MAMMAVVYDVDVHMYIMYGGLGIFTYMRCACEPVWLVIITRSRQGNERNFLAKL